MAGYVSLAFGLKENNITWKRFESFKLRNNRDFG